MSILVGIKQNEDHGTFYGSEGFEDISMSATQFDILKEGMVDDLKEYVKDMTAKAKVARKIFSDIEDNIEFLNISEEEYNEAYVKYKKDTILQEYSKLMILEGIVL